MTDGSHGSQAVQCERCGRDNPRGLRFCQDCGNRLETASSAHASAAPLPEPTAARVRAPAPTFELGSRPSANASAHHVVCPGCRTENPSTGRFCVNCGTPLEARLDRTSALEPPRPPAAPARSTASRPAAAPFAPPPFGHAAAASSRTAAAPAAPVVHVASPGEALNEPPIPCGRCRGLNARHMTFCQFCGARLSPQGGAGATTEAAPRLSGPSTHEPAQLVVIAQDGTPGRQYPLLDEQIDIGREEGTILLPSDPYVSPRHARILRRGGRIFVRDLSSVNGVYVRIRAAERLQHADLVLIGLEVLRFEVVSDAEKGLGPATERGTRVFGSPALPRYARLCQRTVEGATRDLFYLGRDEMVVGRESGDLVFTSDPFMSRRHASITRDPATNTFVLQDLGSSNGTYLAIRGEHEIVHADHIRIGQHLFRLESEAGRTRS